MNKEGNIVTLFHRIIHKYTNNYINTEVRYMKMYIYIYIYMEKHVPIPYKWLKIAFGNKKIYF